MMFYQVLLIHMNVISQNTVVHVCLPESQKCGIRCQLNSRAKIRNFFMDWYARDRVSNVGVIAYECSARAIGEIENIILTAILVFKQQ